MPELDEFVIVYIYHHRDKMAIINTEKKLNQNNVIAEARSSESTL